MQPRQAEQSQFIEHTMSFIGSLLGSDKIAFYQVDEHQRLIEFRLRNIDREFHDAYLDGMHAYDPLHVTRLSLADSSRNIFQLHDEECDGPPSNIVKYREFLTFFQVSDVFEMLFRCEGRVIAGASVLYDELVSFNRPLALLQTVHAYIEFNLMRYIRQSDHYMRTILGSRYGLSSREIDVAELICCGRTNAEIGQLLRVGLATVKTHLIKIYQKLGVENRASVVAFISHLR